MGYYLKSLVVLFLVVGASYIIHNSDQEKVSSAANEKWSNFDDQQVDFIRKAIHVAGTKYAVNYDMVALYVQMQINDIFPSFWDISVYRKQDQNSNFYMTGYPDSTHTNKRFYQVLNAENFSFSVVIVETNNTNINDTIQGNSKEIKSKENVQSDSKCFLMQKIKGSNLQQEPVKSSGLQFTKKKSQYVTTAQEAGIDLAMTTAYTWNKNIVDFTKVVQKLTETNLNQHWQVCTRFQNLSNFSFLYSSPYEEWIEYTSYGLGSYVLHVYLYRNYING